MQLGSNGLSVTSALLLFAHPFGHHARLSRRISATGLGFGSPQTFALWSLVSDPLPHGEQACKIHIVFASFSDSKIMTPVSPVACLLYRVEEDSSSFPTGSGQSQMFCSCRIAAACMLRVPCGRVVVQGVRKGWKTFQYAFQSLCNPSIVCF